MKILGIVFLLITSLCAAQADTIFIENVNVIPIDIDTILKNQRVSVVGNKIISVESANLEPTSSAQLKIDGTGKFLIPGLSEMHYHWRNQRGGIERDLKLLMVNGITNVRNMAEYDWQDIIAVSEKINSDSIFAPNFYTTGPYIQSFNLQSLQDVENIVSQHLEKGYDFMKIADNLPKDIYINLLEKASKNGIDIIGHAQRKLPLEYSLRMKSIEHVEEFVYLFNSEKRNDPVFLHQRLKQLKHSGIYVVPTLVVFDMIIKYITDKEFAKLKYNENATKYMLNEDRDYWLSNENPYRKDLKDRVINNVPASELLPEYYTWMKQFTKQLANAGIPLMTGSDTFGFVLPGFSLHKEMMILQESGLSPYEVLVASTITPAKYLNKLAIEGTISEGKNANLVLLNENPLEDIRNTQSIEGVMIRGKWLDRKMLDRILKEVQLYN